MNEQAPQVDETKFNEMQARAAEAGPEAEARRQKMAEWSDAQSVLVTNSLKHVNDSRERATGRNDDPDKAAIDASVGVAKAGVDFHGPYGIRPVENGVQVGKSIVVGGEDPVLHSPAEIARQRAA